MWLLLLLSDRFSRFLEGGGVVPKLSAVISRFLLWEKGVITLTPCPAGVIACVFGRGKDGGMRVGEGGGDSTSDCGEAGGSGECDFGESGVP